MGKLNTTQSQNISGLWDKLNKVFCYLPHKGDNTMLQKIFLDHPRHVNESYFEHLFFALKFSGTLFLAAGAAFIHAVIPCACEKTASRLVAQLYDKTHNRGA